MSRGQTNSRREVLVEFDGNFRPTYVRAKRAFEDNLEDLDKIGDAKLNDYARQRPVRPTSKHDV